MLIVIYFLCTIYHIQYLSRILCLRQDKIKKQKGENEKSQSILSHPYIILTTKYSSPLRGRPEFDSFFFIYLQGSNKKQRSCDGRGGAQRPVWRGDEPKKTGAHAQPKPTSTFYQSIKNVQTKMKKIRQTNFYTIIASDYPKIEI